MKTQYAIFSPSVFLLTTAFFIAQFCFGQTVFLEKEKLINLTDGVMKREMASFTMEDRSYCKALERDDILQKGCHPCAAY